MKIQYQVYSTLDNTILSRHATRAEAEAAQQAWIAKYTGLLTRIEQTKS